MNSSLQIFTLGSVRILSGGQPLAKLTNQKAKALLIYLASTRRRQPREVLADLLWDERSQSQACRIYEWCWSICASGLGSM